MGKGLGRWFFFTALTVFLLVCALTLPELKDRLLGNTEQRFNEAAAQLDQEVRTVWAELAP